jgi:hypothetical protein
VCTQESSKADRGEEAHEHFLSLHDSFFFPSPSSSFSFSLHGNGSRIDAATDVNENIVEKLFIQKTNKLSFSRLFYSLLKLLRFDDDDDDDEWMNGVNRRCLQEI